jgi:hypothetical protein
MRVAYILVIRDTQIHMGGSITRSSLTPEREENLKVFLLEIVQHRQSYRFCLLES